MRRMRVRVYAHLAFVFIILTIITGTSQAANRQDPAPAGDTSTRAEVLRIQKSLSGVEARLRARDVSRWPAELQRARARNLDVLHDYWLSERFPHNHEVAGYSPIFIDPHGQACAVAHLLIRSDRTDLAEQVDARWHTGYVEDMDSPDLLRWAETSGLTVDELALIQPSYDGWSVWDKGTSPPFPGPAWEYDTPPSADVVRRAHELLRYLKLGQSRVEMIGGRWIGYRGEPTAGGKKGVVAYRRLPPPRPLR